MLKKFWKKVFILFLAITLLFGSMSFETNAAKVTYLEVSRDNAPLRKESNNKGEIVERFDEGRVLESTGSVKNKYGNKWYKIYYDGDVYYIYSENVRKHKCSYDSLTSNDIRYEYCDCGKVKITDLGNSGTDTTKLSSFVASAGTLAMMDGPAPFGDYAAAVILLISGVCMLSGVGTDAAIETIDLAGIDLDKYLEENSGVCGIDSYRRVSREAGKLKYIDDECMDIGQAFIYVYVLKGDVHTQTETAAKALASLYKGGCYSERDKEQPAYFYHYHLGSNAREKVGGHIFYGCNDYGEWPQ